MANNLGLSKKTNIAIAAIGGLSIVKDVPLAIVAVIIIALVALTYQFIIDKTKRNECQ